METAPALTSREITEAYHRIAHIMDQAGATEAEGELYRLDGEALALFDGLAESAEEMLDKLRHVALRLESEARMLRDEEVRLAKRRKALLGGVERVRDYGAGILQGRRSVGLDSKVKTASGTYYLQTSTRLVGPGHISPWREQGWVRMKEEPDKPAAREALAEGLQVDGWKMVEEEGIRWR